MIKKILHIALRLIFGVCLFLSQFTSNRNTFFTDNIYLLSVGVIVIFCSILIFTTASLHLQKAVNQGKIAVSGPYKYIRHPIYTSIYILTFGLGLIFFAWLWFVVMIAFLPLWYLECHKEDKEMIRLHNQEYTNYRQSTGMFVPKIFRSCNKK